MGQDGVDNVQWEGRTSRGNDRGLGGADVAHNCCFYFFPVLSIRVTSCE